MYEELIQKQEELSKHVVLKNGFEKLTVIAGVNEAFVNGKILCGIVVMDFPSCHVIEKRVVMAEETFPYAPGLLTFREGPPIMKGFSKIKNRPDVLMVNGHGIAHPRGFGLASHVGMALQIPTIGVASQILVGTFKEPKEVGDSTPITYKKKEVGYALKTMPKSKPIFVSPGHLISNDTALLVTMMTMRNHKLPEPLFVADEFVNQEKSELSSPKSTPIIRKGSRKTSPQPVS